MYDKETRQRHQLFLLVYNQINLFKFFFLFSDKEKKTDSKDVVNNVDVEDRDGY